MARLENIHENIVYDGTNYIFTKRYNNIYIYLRIGWRIWQKLTLRFIHKKNPAVFKPGFHSGLFGTPEVYK